MSEGREKDAPRATHTHAQGETPPIPCDVAAEAHIASGCSPDDEWEVTVTHRPTMLRTTASAADLATALRIGHTMALFAQDLRKEQME